MKSVKIQDRLLEDWELYIKLKITELTENHEKSNPWIDVLFNDLIFLTLVNHGQVHDLVSGSFGCHTELP